MSYENTFVIGGSLFVALKKLSSKCFIIERDLNEETKSFVCSEVNLFTFLCSVSYRSPGRSSLDDCGERDEKLSKSISFTHESISRVSESESIEGNSPKGVGI